MEDRSEGRKPEIIRLKITNKKKYSIEFVRKKVVMAAHSKTQLLSKHHKIDDVEYELYANKLFDLMGDLYYCSRTWEAWEVGTMGKDDFCLASEDDELFDEIFKKYYQPLTLARILNTIFSSPIVGRLEFTMFIGGITFNCIYGDGKGFIAEWQLLNKDGSEATFQDQNEETQLAITQLLGYDK